jgi:dipeptidyl aminopeptidase/acylaminoacyl peptidase
MAAGQGEGRGIPMTVDLIPLDVLLGNPTKMQPKLSPDGKRMSYIAPVDGVLNVLVGTTGADDAVPVTRDTERGITQYFWGHDNKHLFYVQDQGGDENWRLYSVNLETDEIVDRTPFEGVRTEIVAHRKKFPDVVLVGLNKDNEQLHDVYRLDLTTGDLTKVAENPGFVGWVVDDELKVRSGIAPQPDGGYVIVVRDTDEDEWRPFVVLEPDDAITGGPVGFTKDGKGMYILTSAGANAARLIKKDITSGAEEVLAEDPTFDVVGAVIHPDTREPQLVIFLKEKADYLVLDPSIKADIDAIEALDPNADFSVVDRDHADSTWLVALDDDKGPVKYYSFDRAPKQATFLFEHRPELNDYTLAPMEPFSYKARDGLEVHGYLTFPVGADRANLPTVINVHGGPWHRDTWGLNLEAQFFANRGYLCVQVNFRGSIGYGKEFVNAGDREWGGKMQDDVTDAVQWVIEQGYADPERICIYGGSYGGYATLVGVTFTPELYKCAVSIVGPSSLKSFIESIPPYWAPMLAMFKKRVGDPETEEDFLWSRSPLSKVDNISVPLLIAHGANDPRVKLAETEQIVAAMKEKGIEHDLMVFADEGHGFAKPENRLKFYGATEKFLAKHLGGRTTV